MVLVHSPSALFAAFPRAVFCAGAFDGVHAGHRALLAEAVREAAARGAAPVALSLDPHPAAVLRPGAEPRLLVPETPRRAALLAEAGMAACLMLPFSRETAALSPRRFVESVFGPWIADAAASAFLVCGPNWRFGRDRAGTPADVAALSGGRVGVRVVPLFEALGGVVSSSRIREAVAAGDLALAAALLGRPWEIRLVACGRGQGRGVGAKLGAPTVNAFVGRALRPPTGVYALDVALGLDSGDGAPDAWRRAVANYGFRPTFPDARPDEPLLEIHVLGDVAGDMHGKPLAVRWLSRLRDERAFGSPEALAAQIKADAAAALAFPALAGTEATRA